MSNLAEPDRARPAGWALAIAISNTIAVSALVGLEALCLVLSLDWSLIGIFRLAPVIYIPIVMLSIAGTIWLTVWIFRRAWAIERRLAAGGEAEV